MYNLAKISGWDNSFVYGYITNNETLGSVSSNEYIFYYYKDKILHVYNLINLESVNVMYLDTPKELVDDALKYIIENIEDDQQRQIDYFGIILGYCVNNTYYNNIKGNGVAEKIITLKKLYLENDEMKKPTNEKSKVVTYEQLAKVLNNKFDRDDIDEILLVIKKEFYGESEELAKRKFSKEDVYKELNKAMYSWPTLGASSLADYSVHISDTPTTANGGVVPPAINPHDF